MNKKKSIVVGLGNPILTDDGIGNRIAEALIDQVGPEVDVMVASLGGFNLLDIIKGYDKVVLVDAIQTKGGKAGDIYQLSKDDLSFSQRLSSVHDIGFFTAWELGERLGVKLPREITIFAIEAEDVLNFSETLTPQVAAVIPEVCRLVLEELGVNK